MKNVLITGGAGYIGSHTAKALAHAGFQPVVLDNLSLGHRWAVRWGPLAEGDVGDETLVKRLVEDYNIEAVVHFAASAYVGESMKQPRKYFENNVVNSLALLHAVIESGVENIVFSSTCATYGKPLSLPIREDHPQIPVNPYGESKLFIERTLRWYGEAHKLRFVCLRYFNAAGADPEGEIGESHNPETHLIPLVIASAMGSGQATKIYGTDYPTIDGTAVRDYTHVSDLAHAHVRALCYLADGGESASVNLGTGSGHSVRQVIDAVSRITGRKVATKERPRRPGDPAMLVACPEKALNVLGWSPRYTELGQIIETAWNWHSAVERSLSVAL